MSAPLRSSSVLCFAAWLALAACSSGTEPAAHEPAPGASGDTTVPQRDASGPGSGVAPGDAGSAQAPATQRDAALRDGDAAPSNAGDSGGTHHDDGAASRGDSATPASAVSDAAVGVYPAVSSQHLSVGAHDPSLQPTASGFYLFATGGKLGIRRSVDLARWTDVGSVFASQPAWIAARLGQAPPDLWAPDVSYRDGVYYLYYAGSGFGSNHSVIGLATNRTLDPASADYRWQDQGLILESNPSGQKDDWNAIDPSLALDASGQPWLVFGSFWSGIKLRRVDAATGKLAASDTKLYALASHGGGIEAPSIVEHGGYYYLFVSYDTCCKGVNSTYRTMVGRAREIIGPYLDRTGGSMLDGKAEQLLAKDGRYIGPGGGTAFRDGGSYYYVYHYYDGQANGASFAMLRPITWTDDGWPALGPQLWQ